MTAPLARPDPRLPALVATAAVEDPQWTDGFVRWLRGMPGLRRTAIDVALDTAAAWLVADRPGGRALLDAVLRAPDDPGIALSHWLERHGRPIPKPVKRGIADAATRLYGAATWDRAGRDVVAMCRPVPRDDAQSALFRDLLHGRRPAPARTSAAVPLLTDRELLRHLWRLDVLDVPADELAARLADLDAAPLHIYRAYRMMRTRRWDDALDRALRASAARLPRWPGRTLVHVSLHWHTWDRLPRVRPRGDRTPGHGRLATAGRLGAALGAALATRGDHVDVVGSDGRLLGVGPGDPVLAAIERFGAWPRGTAGMRTGRRRFGSYDRVVTVHAGDPGCVVPPATPWYRFAYEPTLVHRSTVDGVHHTQWGVSDRVFHWVPAVEAGDPPTTPRERG